MEKFSTKATSPGVKGLKTQRVAKVMILTRNPPFRHKHGIFTGMERSEAFSDIIC